MFQRRIRLQEGGTVECLAFVPRRQGQCTGEVWCGRKSGQVKIVDLEQDKVVDMLHLHRRRVTCITVVNNHVWTGSWDGTLVVTAVDTHEMVVGLQGHAGPVSSIVANPSQTRVWTASISGQLSCWSSDRQEKVFKSIYLADERHGPMPVSSLAVIGDSGCVWCATGKLIVAVDADRRQVLKVLSLEPTVVHLLDVPAGDRSSSGSSASSLGSLTSSAGTKRFSELAATESEGADLASFVTSFDEQGHLVLTRVGDTSSDVHTKVPTKVKLLKKLGLMRRHRQDGGLTFDRDEMLQTENSLRVAADGEWCVLEFDEDDDGQADSDEPIGEGFEEVDAPPDELDVTFLGGVFSPPSSPPTEPAATVKGIKGPIGAGCLLHVGAGQVWSCSAIAGIVNVWDANTFECLQQWLVEASGFNTLLHVNNTVWAGANDGSVYVWDSTDFGPLYELRGHNDSVRSLTMIETPAGQPPLVLSGSGSGDGSLAVWAFEAEDEQVAAPFSSESHDSISYDKFGFMRFFEGSVDNQPAGAFEGTVRITENVSEHNGRWWKFMGRGVDYDPKGPEWTLLIRGGIPAKFRKLVWCQIVEARVGQNRSFVGDDYYEKLLIHKQGKRSVHTKQIALDLPRTFPSNRYFQDESCKGVQKLGRILTAFSWFNPRVGYCQGLNRIAGFALFFLEEEDAFWCFVALVETVLTPDYFVDPLIAAHADQAIFKYLLDMELPALSARMKEQDFDIEATSFHWFFGLFVSILPCEVVVRIWDSLLHEGRDVLFRYALALLKHHETTLLKLNKVQLFNFMKHELRRTRNVDSLTEIAFKGLNPNLPAIIEEQREICEQSARQEQQEFQEQQTEARKKLAATDLGRATLVAEAASIAAAAAQEVVISPPPTPLSGDDA
eukprot:m.6731 g.6731  ORF g.6731 m.6731 type:complete len:893 (-) comp2717_c0_seq2:124-2802(-)